MSEGTRRVFLTGSGVGVAAVGLAALAPAVVQATTAAVSPVAVPDTDSGALLAEAESGARALTGPLVAVVHDLGAGEVSLLVGEEEFVVHDEALVARLVRAAAR